MIIGKIKDLNKYKGLSRNIDIAIDYVMNNDLILLKPGKYFVDGENVIVNRDTYVAKPIENCFFENHHRYLDLQIVLKGKEIFGYTNISNPSIQSLAKYDDIKDVEKFTANDGVYFTLEEGFALVYPEDVHLAKCKVNDDTVEKVVIKIKI